MTKTRINKIIYWIATIWLALGMLSTAIVQLLKMKEEVDNFQHLGYPSYLMTMIGIWKILGVVAVLLPAGRQVFLNLLKEWAYAGFFFAMSGAVFSHLASGHGVAEIFGPLLLLILTVVSWYFNPDRYRDADRKIMSVNQ